MQTNLTTPTFGDPRLPARFWEKVNPNGPIPAHRPDLGPCWEWMAGLFDTGYAIFWQSPRNIRAHRLAYETLISPIPFKLEPDHLCRLSYCVNPAHLEIVTHRENVLRSNNPVTVNARKTRAPCGHRYDYIDSEGHRRCYPCMLRRHRGT